MVGFASSPITAAHGARQSFALRNTLFLRHLSLMVKNATTYLFFSPFPFISSSKFDGSMCPSDLMVLQLCVSQQNAAGPGAGRCRQPRANNRDDPVRGNIAGSWLPPDNTGVIGLSTNLMRPALPRSKYRRLPPSPTAKLQQLPKAEL
ncbi:hypothetical protein TcG_00155 [Trypanosoma cruzi]|nr:hypothetical protein TcG_00155 [Trypanosoma cruzi]